jgi:hypothetical protein
VRNIKYIKDVSILQTALVAETHLAEGLEGQTKFPLKLLMRKQHRAASTSRGVKINLI